METQSQQPRSASETGAAAEIHSKHEESFQLQGSQGMSSGRSSQSERGIMSAEDFLCDVLLSGRPVNVSDHTLHHPLYALVHAIPVSKQIISHLEAI